MKTFISLFSGCGGLDYGFESGGFEGIGAFDFDPVVLETYKGNFNGPAYEKDLSKDVDNDLLSKKGVDIVLAGSPCQGFSTIGKRIFNDKRNNLLIKGAEIAIRLDCKIYISENVMGSIAGAHKGYWEMVDLLLKRNNYETKMITLDGLSIGMGQRRKRVIMIATKQGLSFKYEQKDTPFKKLRDVIHNIPANLNNEFFEFENNQDLAIAKSIKPGQKFSDVRKGDRAVNSWHLQNIFGELNSFEVNLLDNICKLRRQIRVRKFGDADPLPCDYLQTIYGADISICIDELVKKGYLVYTGGDKIDLARRFNGKFRRLDWNEPSYTVDTKFGNPKYFIHPDEDRGLSVREAARIQGFEDKFNFYGSIHQKFKMIGNAVPPTMSKIIAQSIKKSLL